MTSCVTPPPRLPQPPARAFAVPTMFFANIIDVQYWHITKVEPANPMNALISFRAVASHWRDRDRRRERERKRERERERERERGRELGSIARIHS